MTSAFILRIVIKMKLFQVPLRASCRIRGFVEELSPDFRRRLRELGFVEGASVESVRKLPFGGPQIFRVADAVYSIEPSLSRMILVDASGTP